MRRSDHFGHHVSGGQCSLIRTGQEFFERLKITCAPLPFLAAFWKRRDFLSDQVDVINRQIFPLMERMIDGLEQSVALDIPFLLEERQDRVAELTEIMARSDVSVAEKFRKVMEAYQIEMDYGQSVEQYSQSIELPGLGVRDYNMLRVGRIGLYFQSDDAAVTGWWNKEQGAWEVLGNEHRNEIRKGLRMARQLIAPELLLLPMPAAGEAS